MGLPVVGNDAVFGASISYLWRTRVLVSFAGSASRRTPPTDRLGFVALDFPASDNKSASDFNKLQA
jgi:hypothetical protein